MIAHVAEASEQRGRVVLQLSSSGLCSDVALEAAVRVAKAFQSEIESLFVESEDLLAVSGFPFARELSMTGRSLRPLQRAVIEVDMQSVAASLQRRIRLSAQRAEVGIRFRTVRDDPVNALGMACAEAGPWNVIALSEPWSVGRAGVLARLLQDVPGMTGIIFPGAKARSISGPVVAVVEEAGHLAAMLRAAQKIAAVTGAEVQLLVAGADEERSSLIEGQVRLALSHDASAAASLADFTSGTPEETMAKLRARQAGFVIAEAFGVLAMAGDDGRAAIDQCEGAVLLIR